MYSFFFWNIQQRDVRSVIANAVAERNVDVLMLAEFGIDDGDLLSVLSAATGRKFVGLSTTSDKVRIFTSIPESKWIRRQTDALSARMSIWSLEIGRPPGIVLAVTHFLAKGNGVETDDLDLIAPEMAYELKQVEKTVGHERSLLVGDLNMNPFDNGVTGITGLHAVMTKRLAKSTGRILQGKTYPFFYNPMWGFFGDRTTGPPGTYYLRSPKPVDVYWHMIDQVLLRPLLMDSIHNLEIVETIAGQSLLASSSGTPQISAYPDHLPLSFRLNLE